MSIVQKLKDVNQRSWHKHLYDALWADHTTKNRETRISPLDILYGIKAIFPLPLELSTLKLQNAIENHECRDALEKRILYVTN